MLSSASVAQVMKSPLHDRLMVGDDPGAFVVRAHLLHMFEVNHFLYCGYFCIWAAADKFRTLRINKSMSDRDLPNHVERVYLSGTNSPWIISSGKCLMIP